LVKQLPEHVESPARTPSPDAIASCTPFEFEILKIAQDQLNKGPHGGNFTPGFVRKETGKGYNAINAALSSLTRGGFLERGSHVTQRDGQEMEISLYKITDKGVDRLMRINSGLVKIEERFPAPRAEPSKRDRADDETYAAIKKLEADVASIIAALNALHVKIDRMGGAQGQTARAPSREGAPRRARRSDQQSHNNIVLSSLKELAGTSRHALAQDVERRYSEICGLNGMKAGSGAYFKKILTTLDNQGLLKRKYVGCKSLGIHGHGSRLMLEITEKGDEHISKSVPPQNT